MTDLISRQAAIELIERMKPFHQDADDILEMMDNMPPADVIPISWIEEQIKWLRGTGNAFAQLTAVNISSLLKTWRDEVKDG